MPAKLNVTLRFRLEEEVERKLGLAPGDVPSSCYVSMDEQRVLAAKFASAAAAQIVVSEQATQQPGNLFDGHDWADVQRISCTCRACIISRAEDMFDELRELATP